MSEKINLMDLDSMRQKVLEYSNLVNDLTDMNPDALLLIEKMNNQRSMMIDYIIKLEAFIQQNHSSGETAK